MQDMTPRRTRHISVRLTTEEYARLEARAHAAAIEISALVRKIILDAPIPARAKHRAPDLVALGRALVALNRIGGNINQIAKAAHIAGDLVAYRDAQQDRAMLTETAQAVLTAIDNQS